ncbi:hypothetical protein AXG93_1679s1000 [Marchantia polymorpha subsp. ruderalis]|uniref:Uncharacterized protein n=1 Tax=Marchantia polymorpha subsp. ruderalis TaxID=1480154 RepID=A0A176WPN4_MARPO|nr:hypothetical protein AXG93_1679s1000 [Marchantia polymorpha subsp. ruderalis]
MGRCAGSDGDLVLEKISVALTRTKEFSYGPLFSLKRQGTNGWKTADYLDPKKRAIALGIMHILRQTRMTYVTAWQRANRGLVAAEVSDSSVQKTMAPIMYEPEVAVGESKQHVEVGGSLEVLIEVPADTPAEPLKEGVEIVSPNSLSSERTRSAGSEETPQPKKDDELMKELTLSEKILEQVVAQVGGTAIEAPDVTLPSTLVEDVRPEEEKKTSGEEVKTLEVTFPDFLQVSVVPLLQYLHRKREKYAISKEVGFYVELIRNMT